MLYTQNMTKSALDRSSRSIVDRFQQKIKNIDIKTSDLKAILLETADECEKVKERVEIDRERAIDACDETKSDFHNRGITGKDDEIGRIKGVLSDIESDLDDVLEDIDTTIGCLDQCQTCFEVSYTPSCDDGTSCDDSSTCSVTCNTCQSHNNICRVYLNDGGVCSGACILSNADASCIRYDDCGEEHFECVQCFHNCNDCQGTNYETCQNCYVSTYTKNLCTNNNTTNVCDKCDSGSQTVICEGIVDSQQYCSALNTSGDCAGINTTGNCLTLNLNGSCSSDNIPENDCFNENKTGNCQAQNATGNCYLINETGHCTHSNHNGDCRHGNSVGNCTENNHKGSCIENDHGSKQPSCFFDNKDKPVCRTNNVGGTVCYSNNSSETDCYSKNKFGDCYNDNNNGSCDTDNSSGSCYEYNKEGGCLINDATNICKNNNPPGTYCSILNSPGTDCNSNNVSGNCIESNTLGDCSNQNDYGNCNSNNSEGSCETQTCSTCQQCEACEGATQTETHEVCVTCVIEQTSCDACVNGESQCSKCFTTVYMEEYDIQYSCKNVDEVCGTPFAGCANTSKCGVPFQAASGCNTAQGCGTCQVTCQACEGACPSAYSCGSCQSGQSCSGCDSSQTCTGTCDGRCQSCDTGSHICNPSHTCTSVWHGCGGGGFSCPAVFVSN